MTEKKDKLFLHETLLRPYVRLAKLVGIGLCVTILVITFIVLGYRGRNKGPAPVPNVIVESQYGIPILFTLFVGSVTGIIFFARLKETRNRTIRIEGHILKFEENNEMISINLRQAKDASFRIMPMFQIIFKHQFHRLGHLSFSSKGNRYSFYFPIKNDSIAFELKETVNS